jgi:hypothetical protein
VARVVRKLALDSMTKDEITTGTVFEVATRFGSVHVVFVKAVPQEGDLVLVLADTGLDAASLDARNRLTGAYHVFMPLHDLMKAKVAHPVGEVALDSTETPSMRYREQLGRKRVWRVWTRGEYGKPLRKLRPAEAALPVKQWVNADMLGMMSAVGYRPDLDVEGPDVIARLAEKRQIDLDVAQTQRQGKRHFIYYTSQATADEARHKIPEELAAEVRHTGEAEFVLIVWATDAQLDWEGFAAATNGEYDGSEDSY